VSRKTLSFIFFSPLAFQGFSGSFYLSKMTVTISSGPRKTSKSHPQNVNMTPSSGVIKDCQTGRLASGPNAMTRKRKKEAGRSKLDRWV
jgi:hypothetical protein